MEEDDIELNIGVKFDESKFVETYDNFLKKLTEDTNRYISTAMADMKGSAAKSWGPLPYYSMHNQYTGNQAATQAFLPSLAKDLSGAGIRSNSKEYESALMNASLRSSMPDPMQRYHRMLSEGYMRQADLTHPDTAIGRMIENDYELLSQPWSRDFIKQHNTLGPRKSTLEKLSRKELYDRAKEMGLKGYSNASKAELINAIQDKSKASEAYVDFDSMRKYAVQEGLGKWIDPEKEHTADNFELINDELEKIDDNSGKSDKTFRNWNDTLKDVLGTLTAIGSVTAAVKGVIAFNKKAEAGTIEAATTLDRRRGLVGMSALEELSAQTASLSIGLGRNAITNEVIDLSNSREKYKLLGEGLNALFPSLTGIFDNIMSSDNPLDTYKGILKEVYGQLKGADEGKRAQTLMLLESQGLGSAAQIIGAFLSNPKLAKELGGDPTALFNLRNNKYYGSYGGAEAVLPDLTKLNESIQASYNQMYLDWVNYFGKPFKGWWDSFLQNKVVPVFGTALSTTSMILSEAGGELPYILPGETKTAYKAFQEASAEMGRLNSEEALGGDATLWAEARDRILRAKGATTYVSAPAGLRTKAGAWDIFGWGTSPSEQVANLNMGENNPTAFLKALKAVADPASYEKGAFDNEDTKYFSYRAQRALNWLTETGYLNDIENGVIGGDKTKAVMDIVRAYIATDKSTAGDYADILDAFTEATVMQSPGWKAMEDFFTTYKAQLQENKDLQQRMIIQIEDNLGATIATKAVDLINK